MPSKSMNEPTTDTPRSGVPSLDDPERTKRECTRFVSDVVDEATADGVVVCLSGGIDSSVSATLAVDALGPMNIYGLLLPADATPSSDLEDAKALAESLGIQHRIVSVQSLVDRFVTTVATDRVEQTSDPRRPESRRVISSSKDRENVRLARGNITSRLRMAIAYFEANTENRLVLGTGNRTELLVGYFTKFGDGGVDLLPIGDLYKSEVRELARLLEIPSKIVEKPPSAGLWEGQSDESELGASYGTIDAILSTYVDDGLSVTETADALAIEPSIVARFADMVSQSAHKRAPPVTPSDRSDSENAIQ